MSRKASKKKNINTHTLNRSHSACCLTFPWQTLLARTRSVIYYANGSFIYICFKLSCTCTLPCNYVRVGTLRSARVQLSCLNRAGMILFVSRMTPQIELHFYSIRASFTRKTRLLGSIFKIIKPGTFSYRQAISPYARMKHTSAQNGCK